MKIFVFGSNLAGIHGAGSAQAARLYHGAIMGLGVGIQNASCAIPTKDAKFNVLPLNEIKNYVFDFLDYAEAHPEDDFDVVDVGCGFAGYKPIDIAPFFIGHSQNVHLSQTFKNIIADILDPNIEDYK